MPERYMDMSAFEKVGPELDLKKRAWLQGWI
jgi:hypothetical protein